MVAVIEVHKLLVDVNNKGWEHYSQYQLGERDCVGKLVLVYGEGSNGVLFNWVGDNINDSRTHEHQGVAEVVVSVVWFVIVQSKV